jgi:hypothetical protein
LVNLKREKLLKKIDNQKIKEKIGMTNQQSPCRAY